MFIIVVDTPPREISSGYPKELLSDDNLALVNEILENQNGD